MVLTVDPLKNILQRLDASRWLVKWAVKLSHYDWFFEPWRAIKAQALANFLAENIIPISDNESHPRPWSLYVDSSSTKDESGAGLIIESPDGE